MKTLTSTLGVLALLGSAAASAASLNVVSSNLDPIVGEVFTLTLTAADFVNPVGGIVLSLAYNPNVVLQSVALPTGAADPLRVATGAVLANFNPNFHWLPGSVIPTGTFAMGTFTFLATAPGAAGIAFSDDGGNESGWFDKNTGGAIFSVIYHNANVCVSCLPQVPVPAAVWLFGSALGVMGWLRRQVTA